PRRARHPRHPRRARRPRRAAGDCRPESRSVLLAECAAQLFATRLAPVEASRRVSIEQWLSEASCLHRTSRRFPPFHQAPAESKGGIFLDIESAPEECPRRCNFVGST